jgi:uncharacterized protein (TIGR02246 family)
MATIALLLFSMAASAAAVQPPAAGSSAADEAAIRAVIARYVGARDARDSAALAELFTADADQYTTSGDWRRGRDRMLPGMAESSRQNPGSRGIDVQAVRFVTADVAVADGSYAIAGSDRPRWTTIVLVRNAGRWRIAAIRNMTPMGPSRPAPVR